MKHRVALFTAVVILGLGGWFLAASNVTATAGPKVSQPPPPAAPAWVNPDGTLNYALVPAFVAVQLPDGHLGYISKADAFGPPPPLVNGQPQANPPTPVFATASGGTIIGYLQDDGTYTTGP